MLTSEQAAKVLRHHASTLVRTMEVTYFLCWDLYGAEVITDETLNTVTTPNCEWFAANTELLKGVLKAVLEDPSRLKTAISVLEKHPSVRETAERMKEDLQGII